MDAVMISIRPKWCAMIARGEKTIEVRKTRPKLSTPFKCYIYCTAAKSKDEILTPCNDLGKVYNGRVTGEFVCDQIEEVAVSRRGGDGLLRACGGNEVWYNGALQIMSRLTTEDICRYIGGIGGKGYGWHISDLKIYDHPRELTEFASGSSYLEFDQGRYGENMVWSGMKRAPQSWCYVEERK